MAHPAHSKSSTWVTWTQIQNVSCDLGHTYNNLPEKGEWYYLFYRIHLMTIYMYQLVTELILYARNFCVFVALFKDMHKNQKVL